MVRPQLTFGVRPFTVKSILKLKLKGFAQPFGRICIPADGQKYFCKSARVLGW